MNRKIISENTIKVAINGFGRIGRQVSRIILQQNPNMEITGVNDLTPLEQLVHLLKYDSAYGPFQGSVRMTPSKDGMIVNNKIIPIYSARDPHQIPWQSRPDIVVEATGIFRNVGDASKAGYGAHLDNKYSPARYVILTVPAKDSITTIVMGVNEYMLDPQTRMVSNASCTTNCLAPVARVLHERFGIINGFMTTIHAYTNDQRLVDTGHSDLRRARAAAQNAIPTSTGAAKAVGLVLPELVGKLDGISVRIPTITGSLVDLVVNLQTTPSVSEINAAMREAAEGEMKGILAYTEDPIVSSDIIGNSASSIFDSLSTKQLGSSNTYKLLTWYDNEWGYSSRVIDLARLLMGRR
ncbi:MAG: type I glyceraldehyde-3-phosphate dehydrogenase [Candidatus Margulisbacteria bacterium]|nr:type I glyceraldehyde-3-phosphate dehydrogenase [Candidatus Margulisiibacteriota bacterium]